MFDKWFNEGLERQGSTCGAQNDNAVHEPTRSAVQPERICLDKAVTGTFVGVPACKTYRLRVIIAKIITVKFRK